MRAAAAAVNVATVSLNPKLQPNARTRTARRRRIKRGVGEGEDEDERDVERQHVKSALPFSPLLSSLRRVAADDAVAEIREAQRVCCSARLSGAARRGRRRDETRRYELRKSARVPTLVSSYSNVRQEAASALHCRPDSRLVHTSMCARTVKYEMKQRVAFAATRDSRTTRHYKRRLEQSPTINS